MGYQLFEFERIQKILIELSRSRIWQKEPLKNLELKIDGQWRDYPQGTYFGSKNRYYTVRSQFSIPSEWQEQTVALQLYSNLGEWDNTTNPQMKIYLNGEYIQAADVNHKQVILEEKWRTVGEIELIVELFSGREEKQFPLYVNLLAIDPIVQKVCTDFSTVFEAWRAIRKFGGAELRYQKVLSETANALDFRVANSPEFYAGIKKAEAILADIYELKAVPEQKVTAVGHTHIDLAWLWTVQQAIEKGERSFQTVMKLMDEYPEYTFIQSQPQMYQFIKDNYPELYQAIKEKIKEGRWEAEGAMWVEADCNLTSGESLVRQILHGKRFLQQEFGKDSQILWLPDVFGYSAALPQLLKKSNTPYFMTTKLSWNQYNQIPYDSFYWQGIDGSRVLTHFITTISEGYSPTPYYATYNGLLDPYTVKGSFERYQQKLVHDEIMIAYGYGDGGGGPTREMLECQRRLQKTLPDMPTITGNSATSFFERLEKTFADQKAPVWFGELYFEYHRGTLTSIGKNKKYNRQGEFLLQTLEKLYTAYGSEHYPQEKLEKLWKNLLLNQFHDILPGSAIEEVYDVTDKEYAALFAEGQELIEKLVTASKTVITLYNPLGIARETVVALPMTAGQKALLNGVELVTQKAHDGQMLAKIPQLASLGTAAIDLEDTAATAVTVSEALQSEFETADFNVLFNEAFEIISLFDKRNQREIVPQGEVLNQLVVYEDLPMNYDAWDIDVYYDQKAWVVADLLSAAVVERGAIRDTLQITRRFETAQISQLIHFYHGTGRIDFETVIDWTLHHLLLKAQLPIAVNTLEATYDIQFGNVKRAIHKNTSWDLARFESCGQKWVDLSEGNYGVSVLTDSKYGFSTDFQKIGVTLIKSATDPYPQADQGRHEFTYSLYAHAGDWKTGQTMAQALDLNVPALAFSGTLPQVMDSFMAVDQENILLDTVKKAEDDETVIVRLYEYHNAAVTARLSAAQPIKKAVLCNLLEEAERELSVSENQVAIDFGPYEVQTVKLYF